MVDPPDANVKAKKTGNMRFGFCSSNLLRHARLVWLSRDLPEFVEHIFELYNSVTAGTAICSAT